MRFIFPLNPHFRIQFWVGGILALWLYLFLAFVGPFDAAELSLRIRSFLMIGYGLVFWGTYLLCFPIQSRLLAKFRRWTLSIELLFIVLFLTLCFGPSYAYYITDWVNGTFSLIEFLLRVYLPTSAVMIPILLVSRYLAGLVSQKDATVNPSKELVTITGNNKQDILRLPWVELIAISAADNYITVYYLQQAQLQKRLLRTTLKQVLEEIPDLLQIHRSHLINPAHFRAWHDGKVIQVHELTFTVSKKYKPGVEEAVSFTPR